MRAREIRAALFRQMRQMGEQRREIMHRRSLRSQREQHAERFQVHREAAAEYQVAAKEAGWRLP